MKVRIHRGTQEIGGTCIEIAAETAIGRVVLDLGRPLDAGDVPLESLVPPVPGLLEGAPDLMGVLISHAHQDHVGLVDVVHSSVPVAIGPAAHRILDRAADWLDKPCLSGRQVLHWQNGKAVNLGPFRITPFLVDHSAFDAYALLIEADGQRLFYSGDFRGHGRKAEVFEHFVAHPPADIDVLLMEGTVIGREGAGAAFPTEQELSARIQTLLEQASGLSLVWTSAQNIDRLVSIYHATKALGRRLIVDAFTADMLDAAFSSDRPPSRWRGLNIYIPDWMRRKIKREGAFDRLERYASARIFLEDLDPVRGDVLLFRPGLLNEYQHKAPLQGAQMIYSNWSGYLEDDRTLEARAWLDRNAILLHRVHTSGHASVPDLKRFAAALAPKRLVPIHSFHGDRFTELFANVDRRQDGEWWPVLAA
jgi:ribonuclease J